MAVNRDLESVAYDASNLLLSIAHALPDTPELLHGDFRAKCVAMSRRLREAMVEAPPINAADDLAWLLAMKEHPCAELEFKERIDRIAARLSPQSETGDIPLQLRPSHELMALAAKLQATTPAHWTSGEKKALLGFLNLHIGHHVTRHGA